MKAMMAGIALACALGMPASVRADPPSVQGELQVRANVVAHARDLFIRERWAEIDAFAEETTTHATRTPSGLWISSVFLIGIQQTLLSIPPTTDAGWDALEQGTLKWAKAQPHSAVARVMYAHVVIERAWAVRGTGYASSVPESAWKPFREHLARAHAYLLAEKAVASRSPAYYEALAQIALGEKEDRAAVDRLLEECEQRFPGYYQAYFAVMFYLLPKWHGSEEDLETFARQSVERTRAKEGESMYARIYWYAAQSEYKDALFLRSNARWQRMKLGFDDVVKRYPDQWNLQNYAHFACEAQDLPTYKAVMARVDSEPMYGAWEGSAGYDDCQRWAGHVKV